MTSNPRGFDKPYLTGDLIWIQFWCYALLICAGFGAGSVGQGNGSGGLNVGAGSSGAGNWNAGSVGNVVASTVEVVAGGDVGKTDEENEDGDGDGDEEGVCSIDYI